MRGAGTYSDEDIPLFQDAWRSMIAEDLEYMSLIQVWFVIRILFTSGSRHTHQQALVLGKNLYRHSQNNGRVCRWPHAPG